MSAVKRGVGTASDGVQGIDSSFEFSTRLRTRAGARSKEQGTGSTGPAGSGGGCSTMAHGLRAIVTQLGGRVGTQKLKTQKLKTQNSKLSTPRIFHALAKYRCNGGGVVAHDAGGAGVEQGARLLRVVDHPVVGAQPEGPAPGEK